MDNPKPLEFKAGALDYFIFTILSIILMYIPFVGWAVLVNYSGGWFAKRAKVTGKDIEFKAGFGESFKLVTIAFFLLIITLGIYSFWFYPKLYRYMAEHTHFAGEAPAPTATEPVPVTEEAAPVEPAAAEPAAAATTAPTTDGVIAPTAEQPTAPTAPQV